MHKSTFIFSLGLFALLVSQGYWLHNMYREYEDKSIAVIDELFCNAMEYEASIRWIGASKIKKGHQFTIKRARDMSAEERKKLKGDTLVLKANRPIKGKSIADIFSETLQDDLLARKPICLPTLDSLFADQLLTQDIPPSFEISLYDQQKKVVKQIDHAFHPLKTNVETKLHPIGSCKEFFIQAKANLPFSVILRHMLYSLLISVLVVVVVIVCLYYQWKALGKARGQLQEQQRMVHGAIHDLKAPLNTVFTLLDYLQHAEMEHEQAAYLKNGKIQIRKLTDTIESMLGLLKSGHKAVELPIASIDLQETVRTVFNGLQTLYPDKQVALHINNRLIAPRIDTDAVRLERCIRNLLENALKYSDEKVEITVTLSRQNNRVSVTVADNGWGIPAKQQKRLGREFYRVERPDKPQRAGFGIGLCSTKQLAGQLGGTLNFQSTEGIGSIFTLIFPIA